jgi:glucose 1-dehydrogenase
MLLKDTVLFVTGSSRGIGRAIAIQAAREGADLIIHYCTSKLQALEVVEIIKGIGQRAVAIEADLANEKETIRLAEEAWKTFGHIEILVNNAAVSGTEVHFIDITTDEFDHTWYVNVRGPLILTQQIAKRMIQIGSGRILTITSVNAVRPSIENVHYTGTKGALEAMMKNIALELSPHGIDVNTIAPGVVETDMGAEARANPELYEDILQGIPAKRAASPEEIARLVCFLASTQSTYMTGSTILVDGGLSLMRGYSAAAPYPYDKEGIPES